MRKQRELENIYRSIGPYVKATTQSTLVKPDFYKITLKAALAKAFDFNSYITGIKSSSHSFYHTATLRGICEDLIVLKALKEIPSKDRSDLVMYLQLKECFEAMKTQGKFFEANHPQIVLDEKYADKYSDDELKKALAIYGKYGFESRKYGPTIRSLAQRANLSEVYDFFYSATSKWVHFSPHVLMRMGWAPTKDPTDTFTFTTKHFSNYYAGFNAVYGTYLFGLFCESLNDELELNPKVKKYIEELGLWIGSLMRWPELITFEEMNIKAPSLILSALYNVTKGYKKE